MLSTAQAETCGAENSFDHSLWHSCLVVLWGRGRCRPAAKLMKQWCLLVSATRRPTGALGSGDDQTPVDKSGFISNPHRGALRPMTIDGPGATESPYTVDAGHFQME
jgi:hypothetical protein